MSQAAGTVDRDLAALQEMRDRVREARRAQDHLVRLSQAEVDRICLAMVEAGEKESRRLAELAVAETGFGRVESKVQKNWVGTRLTWESIKDLRTVGIISRDEARGIFEVAEPVGVIAAIIPTTNPTSTAMFKCLISLKARNAVVVSPHPRAKRCIGESVAVMARAAIAAGAPPGAIGHLANPSIESTNALMKHPDVSLILSTGGPGIVAAAYSSGKPAYGVGPGNCPAYIDRSADVAHAVACLVDSQTFDWGTICASEQSVVVDSAVASAVRAEFVRQGGHFCSPSEVEALTRIVVVPGGMSPDVVGQSPTRLARMAGFQVPPETTVLLAPLDGVGKDYPLSREKLCPILTWYEEPGWQRACERCLQVLAYGGTGHSLVIHATDEKVILEFALEKPAYRLMVNCPSSQGSVGYATNLDPSLTLGCGTPGNNITSDNITARHLMNTKRVAFIKSDYHLGAPVVSFHADESQRSGFVPFSGGGLAAASAAATARSTRARAATRMAAPAAPAASVLQAADIQAILARVKSGEAGRQCCPQAARTS